MTAGPGVTALGPRVLRGRTILLEPFRPEHLADLRRIATDETFRYFPTPDFDNWSVGLQGPARLSFTVRRISDGAVIGSTSYVDVAPAHARVEIGSTWYVAETRGTGVNPEAKLLLLGNAFAAGYNCVALRTDSRNARSRAAILKLGAKQDGILRGHVWMPPGGVRRTGYFRDPVFFSILAGEWPAVKAGLEARLG